MKYYNGATTNKNVGDKTHGSFKNAGQKKGKKGAMTKMGSQKGNKFSKEKETDHVTARLRNISRGLFHTRQGNPMHANPNA